MKTVIITGANRGLGKSLRLFFKELGWYVMATARNIDSLPNPENGMRLSLDLSDYESIQSMANTVKASGYTVDLLINNAGYNPKDSDDKDYFMSTFKIEHFSGNHVAKSLHINALAPTELTSKLLPCLAEDAVVLNISSWLGSIGAKTGGGHYGYAGSKSLLNMFTKAMAMEFTQGQRVAVALNPGWMKTDMGGAKGKYTTEEVAHAIYDLYHTGTFHKKNGEFLNIDGSHHQW